MKLKIGAKIGLGFGVLIALILLMASVSFFALQDSKATLQKIQAANDRMALADDVAIQYKNTILTIRTYAAFGDETVRSQVEGNLNKVLDLQEELLKNARPEKRSEVQAVVDQTKQYKDIVMRDYLPIAYAYHGELRANNFVKALEYKAQLNEITVKAAPLAQGIEKAVDGFSEINVRLATDLLRNSADDANRVITTSLSISGIVLLLGIGIAIYLTRMIQKPVILITDVAAQYAKGDLRTEITYISTDELGELADSIRTMRKNFAEIIGQIHNSADQLAAASEEMAASSEQVTSTSEEVSKNMQVVAREAEDGNRDVLEASTSLLNLSSLIQIAQVKAEKTTEQSNRTMAVANEGKTSVADSIQKMSSIKEQAERTGRVVAELDAYSKQIEAIIETITSIAQQTNLLALNAAIEAARAGEHGRGFAVVAEEVRKLAEQSNRGAQEITEIIQRITSKTQLAVAAMATNSSEVEQGVHIVSQAGAALDKILEAVNETVKETLEIRGITGEEVANSEQIVKLINGLATTVETVAANCEQVSAATQQQTAAMQTVAASAEETSAMSHELKASVDKFKI